MYAENHNFAKNNALVSATRTPNSQPETFKPSEVSACCLGFLLAGSWDFNLLGFCSCCSLKVKLVGGGSEVSQVVPGTLPHEATLNSRPC